MDQPAEQSANEQNFIELLKAFSPELYLIYETQKLTQVSWEVIREAIIALHDVAWNSGWGEVRIFISNGKTQTIQGAKSRKMEIDTIIQQEYTINKS